MITTWYLHSHLTWDWLCHSCISSFFPPHGAFPEEGAYAFLGGMHAGSLEALRVARPEAVDLERIKSSRQLQRRPIQMKRWIVEQTLVPGASVAKVARRHGVNANQVFDWRKQYREGRLVDEKHAPKQASRGHDLIHIGVIDQDGGLRSPPPGAGEGLASEFSGPSRLPPVVKESPVPENSRAASVGRIEIELPNRVKVRVDASIDEAALQRMLAAAGAIA